MSGVRISQLPAVGLAQLTDIFPISQGATTFKETLSQVVTLFNTSLQLGSSAQVTGLNAQLAGFLPLTGGALSGPLLLNADPTLPLEAATKNYVDITASGFTVVLACQAATTANLNAIYNNGAAGIGATLTNNGALAAFVVDGYAAVLNDRILVKNQTNTFENGIYTVTVVGNGATAWVLTRATDYDEAPSEIFPGTLVLINNGTVNALTSWIETATVAVIGTDPILFSQFTFAPGDFLQAANNLSDLADIPTARNNLGLTAFATATPPLSPILGGTGVNNGLSTMTIGGNFILSGAFSTQFNLTGNTVLTLPTTGTLITSSQPTINQPNIVGTTTNNNALAGSVGEFISSTVLFGAAIAIANGVVSNLTSILLTAGDWDVWGVVFCSFAGGATGQSLASWTNNVSATLIDPAFRNVINGQAAVNLAIPCVQRRFSLAVNTTIFLSFVAGFSSTATACGSIFARRVR